MELSVKQKLEILILTLEGFRDEEIALYMKCGLTLSFLRYQRTSGSLPKRKAVLDLIATHFLWRFCHNLEAKGCAVVSGDYLVESLNSVNVKTPTLRTWTCGGLSRFLQKKGISANKNQYNVSCFSKLKLLKLKDVVRHPIFGLDLEKYIPSVEMEVSQKTLKPTKSLTPRKRKIKKAIKSLLSSGVSNSSQITVELNKLGFRNKVGKPLHRWSVKLLMQEFGLKAPEKVCALDYEQLMKDWVLTFPLDTNITKDLFRKKLESLIGDGVLTGFSSVYSKLSPQIFQHNSQLRDKLREKQWREKVEFLVYVKYKHKPITAEELGKELGMSPQHANRIMRKDLGIEPFDAWKKGFYSLVSAFVGENPTFYIQQLAEYLQASYIRTQRGADWDYPNTYNAYQRLREEYPELPESLGRKK